MTATPRDYLVFMLTLLFIVAAGNAVAAQIKQAPLQNQLAGHASPYLALHGKDPVAWQTWNERMLQRARRENKLIFVSIGYFSCHWCHVMQRESYSDASVAKLLNKYYIAIKVDRELNPALDARLIDFVERTRGSAGWPLNVILTPDAYPLLGMTYVPKQQFKQLLKQIQTQWQDNRDFLHKSAITAAQALDQELLAARGQSAVVSMPLSVLWQRASTLFVQQSLNQADTLLGGFGQQAKFPMVTHLNALLDVHHANANDEIAEFLILTLEQMASQNLRDVLGGGFFRYTVDPDWQTPHFEKMLYDNAALAGLYLHAGQQLKRPDFTVIAYQTLDFMVANMQSSQGGMISSFSAVDDKNVEGGYYLWQEEQVRKVLGDKQYAIIQRLWRLNKPSHFEGGYLPAIVTPYDEVAAQLRLPLQEVVDESVAASKALVKQRAGRVLPRDSKRLAAWNGMALKSLTLALNDLTQHGAASTSKRYRHYWQAAQSIHRYLVEDLAFDANLKRAVSESGQTMGQASLEDYVFVADALLDWARLTKNQKDLSLAHELIDAAWQRFYSESGWQQSQNSLLPVPIGVAAISDGALPSPASLLMRITPTITVASKANINSALAMSEKLLLSEPFNYPGLIMSLNQLMQSKP